MKDMIWLSDITYITVHRYFSMNVM